MHAATEVVLDIAEIVRRMNEATRRSPSHRIMVWGRHFSCSVSNHILRKSFLLAAAATTPGDSQQHFRIRRSEARSDDCWLPISRRDVTVANQRI
jgi:hypothetical protein